MTNRRTFLAALAAVFSAGLVLAAPETPPKEKGGEIVGKITKKDGAKITVKGEHETLTLMPYWRGGMPKDGGGFDKEMVAKLEKFKTGDRVKVRWTFEEHYRIDAIERVEKRE
jgi:hypothetical protein